MNAPLVAESAAHSQFGLLPAPTVFEEEQHVCSQHTHTHTICLLPDRTRTERFAFGVSLAKLQKYILVSGLGSFRARPDFCMILYA